jgi:hypothetical protein
MTRDPARQQDWCNPDDASGVQSRMRQSWIAIGTLFLTASSTTYACLCGIAGCPTRGSVADPIFVGTVLAVEDLTLHASHLPRFLSKRKVLLRIDESFGGLPPDLREIDVLTDAGGGDCGFAFLVGKQYLVDANMGEDKQLHAGVCSFTNGVEDAGAELHILRQARTGQRPPSLAGVIRKIERNFRGITGRHPPKGLGGVIVTIRSQGEQQRPPFTLETRSDSEGVYTFDNLPAGEYRVQAEVPSAGRLSWFLGNGGSMDTPYTIDAGWCHIRNLDVFSSGSIEGRVIGPDGQPLLQGLVSILPDGDEMPESERDLYSVSLNHTGSYKFVHLPAGRYLIVINPANVRDSSTPYSRTFYPGASHRAGARVVALAEGEAVKGIDVRLGERIPIQ